MVKQPQLSPFKYWVQQTLPQVYDDSLSFYELLNKVVKFLNDVIESQNATNRNFEELNELFVQLKSHVDNYFENLDVQGEINEKLDNMVLDGTLDQIINHNIFNDLSKQLAQKLTQGNVSVADINKNKGKFDQTYLTEELLEQISGTAPINAVPADNSITTHKMSDKAITPEKTNFLSSVNLFKYGSHKTETTLNPTGGEVEGTGRSVTDFIPIEQGKTYKSSGATFRIALYDTNKNFIEIIEPSENKSPMEFTSSVTGFAKVSFYTESLEGFTLTQTETFEPIGHRQRTRPFYESVDVGAIKQREIKPLHTNFITLGKNLFDKSNTLPNTLLRAIAPTSEANGSSYTSSNYFTSDYILLKKNTAYTLSGIRVWCIYNFDKMFLDGNNMGTNNSTVTIEYPFNCLLRIAGHQDHIELAQVEEGESKTSYEPYKLHIPNLYTPERDNPLEGKTIISLGDSIAKGDGNNYVGYAQLIGNSENMIVTTLAVSGASIGEQAERAKITEQADTVVSNNINYNYIVFNGGTNDSGSPLGQITNGYDDPLDKTTFIE